MKTYHLNPTMTLNTLSTPSTWDKPGLRPHLNTPQHRAARVIADDLVPIPPASPDAIAHTAPIPARSLPPRQPLPTPVLYPDKPSLVRFSIRSSRAAAWLSVLEESPLIVPRPT